MIFKYLLSLISKEKLKFTFTILNILHNNIVIWWVLNTKLISIKIYGDLIDN